MALKRMRVARLAAAHAVGLTALAFAAAAHATDDLRPPEPPVAASPITSAEPDAIELVLASSDDPELSPSDPESPGNTPPPAPATAQLDRVRQGWTQVISPPHAPKSPERASVREPQRWTVVTQSHERQYHPPHVQYHRPSTARSKPRALVLPMASFSSGKPARITRSSSSIRSSNRLRNDWDNCVVNPGVRAVLRRRSRAVRRSGKRRSSGPRRLRGGAGAVSAGRDAVSDSDVDRL
jgi:hypothetical protein